MKKLLLLLVSTCALAAPMTVETLLKLHRIGEPQLSPDGKTIAYEVITPNLEANTVAVVDLHRAIGIEGGTPRKLGDGTRPRWSPDGKRIAIIRNGQVWTISPDGSDAKQVTRISTEADGEIWAPDGRHFLFISDVYPDCPDDACNGQRDADRAKSKVKAHLVKRLLYRHWTAWKDDKRSHSVQRCRRGRRRAGFDARRSRRPAVLARRSGWLRIFPGRSRSRLRQ